MQHSLGRGKVHTKFQSQKLKGGRGVGGREVKTPGKYRSTEDTPGSDVVKLGSCKHCNEDTNKKWELEGLCYYQLIK
jgi:hypothetical protein